MATEAELVARISKLEAQRASGIARVAYDGRQVEYRSVAEIDKALAADKADLAALRPTPRTRHVDVYTTKGW